MLIAVAFGAANALPAQADATPVVMITVWNGTGGRYHVQLGLVWLTSTLEFTRDGSNPQVGVQVAQNSTGSSCSGL
ncbi:hypothetical protein ACQP06_33770 [Nocardia sp. CA-136227]|uniref:hypothetical protein n=1 Tax=Nocardia sp. CA-136227 TaxID=3239979 RepID=UPI003D98D3AD